MLNGVNQKICCENRKNTETKQVCCFLTLLCVGDRQFSRAVADYSVAVHRTPSESAEEHDGHSAVLLSYGVDVLHPLHVHG